MAYMRSSTLASHNDRADAAARAASSASPIGGGNWIGSQVGGRQPPIAYVPLAECLRVLAAGEASFERYAVRADDVTFCHDGTVTFGENRLRLEDVGRDRLAARLGAPAAYIARLPGGLQRGVLEHDFRRAFADEQELGVVAREGCFVNLTERSLLSLTTSDVLVAVAEALQPLAGSLRVRSQGKESTAGATWVDGGSVQIQLVTSDSGFAVVPGDIVRAGVQVTHSPLGAHATWIEAFFDRLVCSNGMTIRECVGRKGGAGRTRRLPTDHPEARQLQLEQVQRLARIEWAALTDRMDALRRLEDRRIDDIPALFARWLEQARLSARSLLPRLQRAWEQEGARPTLWGAVNAFTDVGTHDCDLPYRARRLLSGLGGILAFRDRHLCSRCFSRLTSSVAAE